MTSIRPPEESAEQAALSRLNEYESQKAALHLDTAPSDNVIVARAQEIKPLIPHVIEDVIAAGGMILLFAITLANVFARYVVNFSFAFTEEYSSVILYIIVFVMASSAIVKNSHIKMTFFTDMMSAKFQKMAEAFGAVAMIVCFAILTFYGSRMAFDAYRFEEMSAGLGHPVWIYLIWVPLLALVAMLRSLGLLKRVLMVRVT